jgi:acetamidase/formamidase
MRRSTLHALLRISSIFDVPNWVVSLYFPRIVLE